MPTGYTADVQDGKVTEFKDFALRCARAFGALVEMRESAHDAPVPETIKPTSYNAERLEEARQELERLTHMSNEDAEIAAENEYQNTVKDIRKYQQQGRDVRERYERMLTKVDLWNPPTPEHCELKTFMRQQLEESIKFDCGDYWEGRTTDKMTGEQWRKDAMSQAVADIEYHSRAHKREVERAESRTKWLQQLRASL